jgi:hypothetical protein
LLTTCACVSLSCSLLSLDAMDVSGQTHGDIVNNVFKKRLDENGKPFDQSIRNEVVLLAVVCCVSPTALIVSGLVVPSWAAL